MLAGANNVLRTSVFGLHLKRLLTVADTDLQIRGSGWGGHPDPEIGGGGGGRSPKNIFVPFGPQFGLKYKGAAGPPSSSPGSVTGLPVLSINI